MNEEYDQHIRPTETLSTIAPRDAPINDVRAGIEQAQQMREQALASSSNISSQSLEVDTAPSVAATTGSSAAPVSSTLVSATTTGRRSSERSRFSLLRSFSKRTKSQETDTVHSVQPYPGT